MDARREGFADARLDVDLDYLPSFPFAFNEAALLRDGLVAVHVEVDLFSGWIAVVPEHDLLGRLHVPHPCQLDAGSRSCAAFETTGYSPFLFSLRGLRMYAYGSQVTSIFELVDLLRIFRTATIWTANTRPSVM